MKIRQFLDHHGIADNPFADEDAQTDVIFKGFCITSTYHPTWDQIYGNPAEPATAVVFGEKGSGKTAIGLQVVRHLTDYNASHPAGKVFVIRYDDFNPYLDRYRERFSGRRRRVDKVLAQWKLWDHMDAILALGVTQLVDRILGVKKVNHPAAVDGASLSTESLDRSQARDVLLLAACYDQSTAEASLDRWRQLRRKLRLNCWKSMWDLGVGAAVTVIALGLFGWLAFDERLSWKWAMILAGAAILAGWLPRLTRLVKWHWRAWSIKRSTRVLNHNTNMLRRCFMKLPERQLIGQPLPAYDRTDDRYELLVKFQDVLRALGFNGVVVLVDRVDEPYLINGSAELMRMLLWPMLDNKLLKHPGVGFKLLVPAELNYYVEREGREFHQRARLDKQNVVRSLDWTGQSLADVADARLKASSVPGRNPTLRALLDDSISDQRILDALRSLRVPRHMFKFLYRLIVAHANAHTEERPSYRVSGETFEATLALYQRELDSFDRSVGTV